MAENIWENENLIKMLKNGGVAVMPTDTIYGIVGQAQNISTVNRIYDIKKRNPEKPFIVLIGNEKDLEKFSVVLSGEQKNMLGKYWSPYYEAVSVILDCPNDSLAYLSRGTKTLAFRLPRSVLLKDLLSETGPLIAPSANPEDLPPAETILQAKQYFENTVDLYLDGGTISGKPSKLIKLHKDGTVNILRE